MKKGKKRVIKDIVSRALLSHSLSLFHIHTVVQQIANNVVTRLCSRRGQSCVLLELSVERPTGSSCSVLEPIYTELALYCEWVINHTRLLLFIWIDILFPSVCLVCVCVDFGFCFFCCWYSHSFICTDRMMCCSVESSLPFIFQLMTVTICPPAT